MKRWVVACSAFALAAAAGPAQAASLSLSTSPKLQQAFTPSGLDYTVPCTAGSVSVTISSPSGTRTRLDGKLLRTGRTTTKVRLSAGKAFKVSTTVGSKVTDYSVRCLPTGFPAFSVTGKLPASSPFLALSVPGLTSVGAPIVPYAFVVDARGVPIWWKHIPGEMAMDVKPTPGGKIGFWRGVMNTDTDMRGRFSEYSLDGKLVRNMPVFADYDDSHETLMTANGHYYRIADYGLQRDMTPVGGADGQWTLFNRIEEFDEAGNRVWTWKSSDHLGLHESDPWIGLLTGPAGVGLLDIHHMNSIEEDGQGGLLVSFRYTNSIYRIDKATGEITWKLGGTATGKSLTVVGDDEYGSNPLMGQHDARIQPDGTITIYDNGSGVGTRAPRVTRWRIDSDARTATLVESFADPAAPISLAGGGARRLADGSWVVSWCAMPYVRAYGPTHALLFSLKFTSRDGRSYRAAPVRGSGFSRAAFVAGMDRQYPR